MSSLLEEELAKAFAAMPEYVQCPNCHTVFAASPGQKYCSNACGDSARHKRARKVEKRICLHCGEWYEPTDKRQLYCKKACMKAAYEDKNPGRHNAPTVQKTCALPGCGKTYSTTYENKIYCSQECAVKANRIAKTEWDKEHYVKILDRPFVAWDGEGEDGKYTLLANSRGDTLEDRDGLSTYECLEFLLNHTSKDQVNVWFSFGYDVSMMLKDIPLFSDDGMPSLARLHSQGHIKWRGYEITYHPRKRFHVNKNGRHFTSFDTFGFFQQGFVKVIDAWLKRVPEIITEGKQGREEFRSWDMEKIKKYNLLECELLAETMEKFRESIQAAGLTLKSWHGPAALAKEWLKTHDIAEHIRPVPRDMQDAVMRAYFGGRIEMAGWGHAERVWHYDINSAYPRALCEIPSLADIEWVLRQGSGTVDSAPTADFTLCHVRWSCRELFEKRPYLWGPFPYRDKSGTILYPQEGEGWYWNVEVKAAQKRFPGKIDILEWWEPEGIMHYPLREPLMEIAEKRLRWKAEKNPANVPLKLVMNSLYGVFAEKKGYVRDGEYHKPPFQCHAWAGFVTAYCRAMINDALRDCGGKAVLVMTDSLWALEEIKGIKIGEGLGEWTFEEEDVTADFCGAGLYQSYDAEGKLRPKEYKSRGFSLDQGDKLDYGEIIREWVNSLNPAVGEWGQRKYKIKRFIGIGLAVSVPKYAPDYGTFIEIEKKLDNVALSGQNKRMGHMVTGNVSNANGIHWLIPAPAGTGAGHSAASKKRGRRMAQGEQTIPGVTWNIECSYPYRIGKIEQEAGEEARELIMGGEDEI